MLERDEARLDGNVPWLRKVVEGCPFCSKQFTGSETREVVAELGRHISRSHPLARPVVLVNGNVLGTTATIASVLSPADIVIENATDIEASVDGATARAITLPAAVRLLSSGVAKRWLILRLVNNRSADGGTAAAEFRIKIDIADTAELDVIDAAFIQHLAREDPTEEDLRRFSDETDGLANEYRDGLASYIIAIRAKDGRSMRGDREQLQQAQERLSRSAHLLANFAARRVGAGIAACARLNLNDFSGAVTGTGVSAVDLVTTFFVDLVLGQSRPRFPEPPSGADTDMRCPIDTATASIIELVFRLAPLRNSFDLEMELDRMEHASLTPTDRAKLAVVVGEWADRHGQMGAARRCSGILDHDPMFQPVAERWRAQ